MKKIPLFFSVCSLAGLLASAQTSCNPSASTGSPNCGAISTGFIPVNDLGTGTFINSWSTTWTGGLYPGGSNYLPAAHKSAGLTQAAQIQPLDATGNPNVNGKIVLLSIGLSNTNIEFCEFDSLASLDNCKNPKVVVVNGAQGGMPMQYCTTPSYSQYNTYWNNITSSLTNRGVTANQVQAIWLKHLNPGGATPIHAYYDTLVAQFKRVMIEMVNRYPNVKVCYMSSRITARYSCSSCGNASLNPEPFAYYQGWACKEVIEDQINGNLPFTGGSRVAPWISWGPYLWSDGNTPRQDGFFLNCPADLANDGTHPSLAGARKVGDKILCFLKNDSTAYTWFNTSASACPSCLPAAGISAYSKNNSLIISPNPATDRVSFSFYSEKTESTKLEVLDARGQLLYSESITSIKGSNDHTLDTRQLAAGIYLIKLSTAKEMTTKKMIIQK